MCLTFWQCCVISESFYAYHWQCYVSNRNGALFVAIGKLMEIGIGGFLLPRTKVLRKWQIHSKQLLHHLHFCRSVRQVFLPRCGKLQLQVPQNSGSPKKVDCTFFRRSIARPDEPSKDNFLEDLVGSSSDACQMGSVLHTKLQSVIQVLVMVSIRVVMASIRIVVPKVKKKRKRRDLITQEGLLDSLLPHLVQQKGMFKVSSKF